MTSVAPTPAPPGAHNGASPRRGQLALTLQEAFTAIVRLRSNRQVAANVEAFRAQMKNVLATAEQEARRIGYASDDVRYALFAVIGFIDESVLNSQQPMFAHWGSRPLQEEVFGGATAGELFFQYLQQLLGRQDSEDLADVLEVYQLCLLLGFKGRYSVTHGSELQVIAGHVAQKIERARGRPGGALAALASVDAGGRRAARSAGAETGYRCRRCGGSRGLVLPDLFADAWVWRFRRTRRRRAADSLNAAAAPRGRSYGVMHA